MSLFLLLIGCATIDPEITRRANIRRWAEDRLHFCLKTSRGSPTRREACKQESIQFCVKQGLERSCGIDGLWTR